MNGDDDDPEFPPDGVPTFEPTDPDLFDSFDPSDGPMTDDPPGVYRSYADGVRIAAVPPKVADGPQPLYRFDAPQHEPVTFADPEHAELYAAVYFAVDGFRAETVGRKGVPLAVARADDAVIAAYTLAAWDGTSRKWLTRTFGVDHEQVQTWLDAVRERAGDHPALADGE